MQTLEDAKIAIVGLGYVGLPLAVAFGRRLETIGFDIDPKRIAELRQAHDSTCEVTADELRAATQLRFAASLEEIAGATVYIVTVPTPIDDHNRPDLGPLERASKSIGKVLGAGDIVIYESTVYPGATEEVCVPILEHVSGLACNRDFYVGYSPERINPGDREHRLETIRKVTSGSTPEAADFVDALYRLVVTAGTHRASSIRVAEAAKVIENTQRDLNIALVNELAIIFHRLGIDTLEVLEAAGTKWNFLPFRPGLVGGHCIGVDPYYLTYKAEGIGYHPEVILAGRRINDNMGRYIAAEIVKMMIHRHIPVAGARVLVLGLAFKEDCPDLRNTRVVDVIEEFKEYGCGCLIHDPLVDAEEARREYGLELVASLDDIEPVDVILLAVPHAPFLAMGAEAIRRLGKANCLLYDVKSALPKDLVDGRL
ncbi:MAG: nucleotide sugar dehydrogenase [Alphaproteobacteria bacterium]|nr:MAG: nucleotide sugar dehydrogenase [Alphaproteobacteria bacterium]